MWILILTLYSYGYGQQPAITSVPNFKSKESCLSAGQSWMNQQAHVASSGEYKALCVPS